MQQIMLSQLDWRRIMNNKDEEVVRLPIAETFTSIHGEGSWAGTPMTFIRLAGCTVGKIATVADDSDPAFVILPDGTQAFMCTTFDGRTFPCDTNYRKTTSLDLEDILSCIPTHIKHVCITGGEPLMHLDKLEKMNLVFQLIQAGKQVHFETSGTIMPPCEWESLEDVWWACSPKANYLPEFLKYAADEVRVMVDKHVKTSDIERLVKQVNTDRVDLFFAPISADDDVTKFDPESLIATQSFVNLFPNSRISIQMHKVLNVR